MSISEDLVSRQDSVLPRPAEDDSVLPRPAAGDSVLPHAAGGGIDPRGPQFAAALTAVVLASVLLLAPHPAGIALLAAQTVLFALGAVSGVQRTPHAWLFRTTLRPRLAPPTHLEDPAPPRFAQAVGLGFALVGLVAFLAGATVLGQVAVGFALTAALLNAAFAFCLGCELFLLVRRIAH